MTWSACFSHDPWGKKRERGRVGGYSSAVTHFHHRGNKEIKSLNPQATRGFLLLSRLLPLNMMFLELLQTLKSGENLHEVYCCLSAQAACLKSASSLQQQQEWYRILFHEASHLNKIAGLEISWVLTPSERNKVPLWSSNRPTTSLSRTFLLSRDLNSPKDDDLAAVTSYDPTK